MKKLVKNIVKNAKEIETSIIGFAIIGVALVLYYKQTIDGTALGSAVALGASFIGLSAKNAPDK